MKIIETNLKFKALKKRSDTKKIVIHHADAIKCTAEQIHEWHLNRGWSGAGYHFFIRKDGSIYRLRPEWAIGAHCSKHNSDSIGICFEGDYENHDKSMPSNQIQSGIALISSLKSNYNLNKIYQHKELRSTSCPGRFFPTSQIIIDAIDLNYPGYLIKNGSKGKIVESIQSKLNELGFNPGIIDGIFGPNTKSVVIKFQKAKNISTDGIVGPITWNKLFN